MADQRVVRKSLGGQNDLVFGRRKVVQTRAGGTYNIDAVTLVLPIDDVLDLASLDPVSFPEVVLYEGATLTFYKYDASLEVYTIRSILNGAYTTAQRTTLAISVDSIGLNVFDTDLGKPVWVKSTEPTVWVDATGV
jgi:hypothetical protein